MLQKFSKLLKRKRKERTFESEFILAGPKASGMIDAGTLFLVFRGKEHRR